MAKFSAGINKFFGEENIGERVNISHGITRKKEKNNLRDPILEL